MTHPNAPNTTSLADVASRPESTKDPSPPREPDSGKSGNESDAAAIDAAYAVEGFVDDCTQGGDVAGDAHDAHATPQAQSGASEALDVVAPQSGALGQPLETCLVDDMRQILTGDIVALVPFVQHLLYYFEEGARPGMSAHEFTDHLTRKATFVLNELLHLSPSAPVVADASVPAIRATNVREIPRLWLVLAGACVTTPAWRFSATLALQEAVNADHLRYPAMALLLCMGVQNAERLFVDGLLMFTAVRGRAEGYSISAAALAFISATWRFFLR